MQKRTKDINLYKNVKKPKTKHRGEDDGKEINTAAHFISAHCQEKTPENPN